MRNRGGYKGKGRVDNIFVLFVTKEMQIGSLKYAVDAVVVQFVA